MSLTLAQALSPLREVFESVAYERFVARWIDKKLTQREIQSISYALSEYSYVFKRPRLLSAIERAEYVYSSTIQTHRNAAFASSQDDALKQFVSKGVGTNPWLAAVTYAFNELASEVNTRSDSGKMVFRLFMASVSVLRSEGESSGRRKTSDPGLPTEHTEEVVDSESETGTPVQLDPSTMTLDEQIEAFNLHRDTYW